MPSARRVKLDYGQRQDLMAIRRSKTQPQRYVLRAKIILRANEGWSDLTISEVFRVSRQLVARWRGRFLKGGIRAILTDAPRTGRPKTIAPHKVRAVVALAQENPPPAKARWSRRAMAAKTGLSPSTVGRIWKGHGVRPHKD